MTPYLHFSPPTGSINDPNGLVFHKGEYHLFYQKDWGEAWGHSISSNLFSWNDLPDALERDKHLGNVASGSAVFDADNTSNLGSIVDAPIVAIYTGWDRQVQCLASSTDNGRTWEKYAGNPVLEHPHRDPKVFWHQQSEQWIMVLYDGMGFSFFASSDLKRWVKKSHIANGFFECCDLFELEIEGNASGSKWVLVSGDLSYQIGSFDGSSFTSETDVLRGDWGNPPHAAISTLFHHRHLHCSIYAPQTWNGLEEQGSRRIQIAWLPQSNEVMRDCPSQGHLSIPCLLSLIHTGDGLRLKRYPVNEIEDTFPQSMDLSGMDLEDCRCLHGIEASRQTIGLDCLACDLDLEIHAGDAIDIGVWIGQILVSISIKERQLVCKGRCMPLLMVNGYVAIRIVYDVCSIEIFADNGIRNLTTTVPIREEGREVSVYAAGKGARVLRGIFRYFPKESPGQ